MLSADAFPGGGFLKPQQLAMANQAFRKARSPICPGSGSSGAVRPGPRGVKNDSAFTVRLMRRRSREPFSKGRSIGQPAAAG